MRSWLKQRLPLVPATSYVSPIFLPAAILLAAIEPKNAAFEFQQEVGLVIVFDGLKASAVARAHVLDDLGVSGLSPQDDLSSAEGGPCPPSILSAGLVQS